MGSSLSIDIAFTIYGSLLVTLLVWMAFFFLRKSGLSTLLQENKWAVRFVLLFNTMCTVFVMAYIYMGVASVY